MADEIQPEDQPVAKVKPTRKRKPDPRIKSDIKRTPFDPSRCGPKKHPTKPLVHKGPPDGKCHARKSKKKTPCGNKAIAGAYVCHYHGGSAPQVKRKAKQRIMDALADALDPNRVLREAGRLAYSDIRELFDDEGNFLPVKQWPDNIARAVASVEVVKRNVDSGDGKIDDVIKIRLWDKVAKLGNLMKFHGQLTEKVELSVKVDVVSRLEAGRKRVAEARQKELAAAPVYSAPAIESE